MDIGKSIQFAFDDEHWITKLGLGALISMIPILNFAWIGYTIEIMRRVVAGNEIPLPDWDDLGARWVDGLFVAFAALIYALPGTLLLCLPIGIMTIPAFLQNQDSQGIVALLTTTTGLALLCCLGFYFLAFSFILPAVQLSYSQSNNLQSCFNFRQIIQWIRANVSGYLTAWLITLLASFIISSLIGILGVFISWILCIGQIVIWIIAAIGSAWTTAISAHLFGQFGRKVIPQVQTSTLETEILANE